MKIRANAKVFAALFGATALMASVPMIASAQDRPADAAPPVPEVEVIDPGSAPRAALRLRLLPGTSSRTFSVYGLVPTARLSDFWNFAVAIICIVLVIFRMFRTALRRFTIARAFAIGGRSVTAPHPVGKRA